MAAKKKAPAKKKKSTVNKAGNYTKPALRKRLFNQIKAGGKGGSPVSGLRVKRRCWPKSTKILAGAIEINGPQEVAEVS